MAPLRGVKPVHPDDWKAKGPAEAATSPSRGPKQSEGSAMNRMEDSTAASGEASEAYYRSAFSGLESSIGRVVRFASVTNYLVEILDEERRRHPGMEIGEALVEHLVFISSETQAAAQDLDREFYQKHNAGPWVVQ